MQQLLTASSMLTRPIVISGPTLFEGKFSSVHIATQDQPTGLVFIKKDRPDCQPILATAASVVSTARTTILGNSTWRVALVEHLMAALFAYNIQNALITVDGDEIPVGDGSAIGFVQAIKQVGFSRFAPHVFQSLDAPLHFEMGASVMAALPYSGLKLTYMLHYENLGQILAQHHTLVFDPDEFEKEIAPARTFALKTEILEMQAKGMLKNATYECGIVIDEGRVLNPEGLRFENEMARHKIVDMIGDLALANRPVGMHAIAIKGGHAANVELSKRLKMLYPEKNHDA